MKIKIGDKVYLQKYEVAHILHDLWSMPMCIVEETLGDDKSGCFVMKGPRDCYNFECVYEDPDSVKWLMEQEWIVDYDEYAEKSVKELQRAYEQMSKECFERRKSFMDMDYTYRMEHHDEMNEKQSQLIHKITSIEDLIVFREGFRRFKFPRGYRGKRFFVSRICVRISFIAVPKIL